MIRRVALTALALTACADLPSPEPVVDAERAFAADFPALGFKGSFLKHSAPDAIVLQPDPANAQQSLGALPDLKPDQRRALLTWWPTFAGISRSGDLGFTTGPYAVDGERQGHYFTVWRKQQDGSWKWIFDAGVGATATDEPGPDGAVTYLPTAKRGDESAEAAHFAVRKAEDALAAAAQEDAAAAVGKSLADDARVHSEGHAPAKSAAEHASALAARARHLTLSHLGGAAAASGDLVWTYGEARWSEDGGERRGHYVRMWQLRPEGWRIVFDELVPVAAET